MGRIYQSWDQYVLDDPHRLIGPELDMGWWPTGTHPRGARLTWSRSTGELYLYNSLSQKVAVLAHCDDEEEVRRKMEGWEDVCGSTMADEWLTARITAWS